MRLIFLFLMIWILGCTGKVENQVNDLKSELESVKKDYSDLKLDFYRLKAEVNRHKSAFFSSSSTGFSRVDSQTGSFLVSLTDIKPYADGYKAKFNIGNPNSAHYIDPKVKITYGKAFDPSTGFEVYEKSRKEVSHSLKKTLLPGSWNSVELILAPATKEQVGEMEFTIESDSISLRR